MPFRTLHCANGALYLIMSLAVAACAAWAIASGRICTAWQVGAVVLATLAALVWGGFYALLRWEVGPEGISRCLLRRRFYPWHSLKAARTHRSDRNGVATCTLELCFAEGELELSSQLLPLEALEQLRDDLAAAGLMPPPEEAPKE